MKTNGLPALSVRLPGEGPYVLGVNLVAPTLGVGGTLDEYGAGSQTTLLRAQGAAKFLLDLLAAPAGVAVGVREALLGGRPCPLAVDVEATALGEHRRFEDRPNPACSRTLRPILASFSYFSDLPPEALNRNVVPAQPSLPSVRKAGSVSLVQESSISMRSTSTSGPHSSAASSTWSGLAIITTGSNRAISLEILA
jgi:hypothetical protein